MIWPVANSGGLLSLEKRTTKIETPSGIAFVIAGISLPFVVQNLFMGVPKAVDAIEETLPSSATKTAQTIDTEMRDCTEFITGCSRDAITKQFHSISTMVLAAYRFVMSGKMISLRFKIGLFSTDIKTICL